MTPEHLPVFVYGTLRPGCSNNGWFRGKVASEEPAHLSGAVLVSNGRFPYLLDSVAEAQDDARVVGTLVRIDPADWAEVAVSLDALEETDPQNPAADTNLYNRLAREVVTDSGTVRAWVYIPPISHQAELFTQYSLLPSGNWLDHELTEPAVADISALPEGHYGEPGELRDQLVAAILAGKKTGTSFLALEAEIPGEEDIPEAGYRKAVLDSYGNRVCVTEVVSVEVLPLSEINLQHALDEGEGYESVADWREGHLKFWTSDYYKESLGEFYQEPTDETLVVYSRFRVIPHV